MKWYPMKTSERKNRLDWPLILLVGLTGLGLLIIGAMLVAIPVYFLS